MCASSRQQLLSQGREAMIHSPNLCVPGLWLSRHTTKNSRRVIRNGQPGMFNLDTPRLSSEDPSKSMTWKEIQPVFKNANHVFLTSARFKG